MPGDGNYKSASSFSVLAFSNGFENFQSSIVVVVVVVVVVAIPRFVLCICLFVCEKKLPEVMNDLFWNF